MRRKYTFDSIAGYADRDGNERLADAVERLHEFLIEQCAPGELPVAQELLSDLIEAFGFEGQDKKRARDMDRSPRYDRARARDRRFGAKDTDMNTGVNSSNLSDTYSMDRLRASRHANDAANIRRYSLNFKDAARIEGSDLMDTINRRIHGCG
jgi:hypothetical protein